MAFAKKELVIFMITMVALTELSMAAVHRVGDSDGWKIPGNSQDYQDWAASNKFHVGDTLSFEYQKQSHNVYEVSAQDFESCNANNPIASHSSGSDDITLKRSGDYYFLCGISGHCQAGMKLHVTVNSASNNSPPSPSASNNSPPSPGSDPYDPYNWFKNVAPSTLGDAKLGCLAMVAAAAILPFFVQLV